MAFDLTSAKEIQPDAQPKGFDMSTAKAVEVPNEVVYQKDNARAVEAPVGLKASEFDYMTARQVDDKPSSDYFGFTNVAIKALPYALGFKEKPKEFARAAVGSLERMLPEVAGGLTTEIGELMKQRRDDPNFPSLITNPVDVVGKIPNLPENIAAAGKGLLEKNNKFLDEMGLSKTNNDGFVFDLGSGAGSVLASTAMSFITGSAKAAAIFFGLFQKSQTYQETRKAQEEGKFEGGAVKASGLSTTFAIPEAVIELYGGKFMLGAAGSNQFAKIVKRSFGEAIQESAQQVSEETIAQVSGLRDVDVEGGIKRTLYAGLLGFLVGAPIHAVTSRIEAKGKEEGLSKEQIATVQKIAEKNGEGLSEVSAQMMTDETSPLVEDDKVKAEVTDIINKFNSGEEITLPEDMNEEEQEIARVMAESTGLESKVTQRLEDVKLERITQLEQEIAVAETEEVKVAKQKEIEQFKKEITLLRVSDDVLSNKQELDSLGISIEDDIDLINAEIVRRGEDGIQQDQLDVDKTYSPLEIARMQPAELENIKQAKLAKATSPEHKARIEKKYGDVQKLTAPKKISKKEKFKDTLKDFSRMTNAALTPISSRLKRISPKLKVKLRKFEHGLNKAVQEDHKALLPFLEKFSTMEKQDQIILDYAMKNGDIDLINEIAQEYDMVAELQTVRDTLEDIYDRAEAVGYDVGYIENFFPRHVVDSDGLLAHFEKSKMWNAIDQAIKEKENVLGRALDNDEKAHMINTLLRGYKTSPITLAKPSGLKERSILEVTPEINDFYNTTDQALIRYFTNINEAIEARKFFGKGASKDVIENLDDSIGFFVLNELASGNINQSQARELTDIMSARFNRGNMSTFWNVYKNLSYIDTMGSVTSAITQIGDVAFAMYKNGFFNTGATLFGKKDIKMEDIGIDRIAQEFENSTTTGKAVTNVFKWIGLEKMDRLGKETLINSSLKRYTKLAKNPTKEFTAELENTFEEETDQVIKDLKDGVTSENVKLLLFNDLLDFQPVALSEMPEAYLKAGNGRIFYMLKTFTLKQLDVYRNEVFDQMKENPVKAIGNLTRLAGFFIMMNAGADFLKDLILGRDTPIEDYVVNNILRAMGISKFQIYSARREGIGSAAAKTILPPFKLIDSVYKDIAKAIDKGEIDIDKMQTLKSIPHIGKLYYWWFGAGSDKGKKKRKF